VIPLKLKYTAEEAKSPVKISSGSVARRYLIPAFKGLRQVELINYTSDSELCQASLFFYMIFLLDESGYRITGFVTLFEA
jgi:hypothetical protein